jgi:hypothetical protein
MAPKRQHPPGPPMTLGNMRELGVQNLIASCLNDACRQTALIDVSNYPADTDVPSFRPKVKCGKSGARNVDVRPNWKELGGLLVMQNWRAGCQRFINRQHPGQRLVCDLDCFSSAV